MPNNDKDPYKDEPPAVEEANFGVATTPEAMQAISSSTKAFKDRKRRNKKEKEAREASAKEQSVSDNEPKE